MSWQSATREEVLARVAAEMAELDPEYFAGLEAYLVEPYSVVVNRFDEHDQVFVVARSTSHVIFFEDIEGNFCLARESNGRLSEVMDFVDLGLNLREMRRMEGL